MMTKPIIRTITAFVNFRPNDFESTCSSKVQNIKRILQGMELSLKNEGYTVQTKRVATNPFGEWLFEEDMVTEEDNKNKRIKKEKMERLTKLDNLLSQNEIEFCSLGPAKNRSDASLCPDIVSTSHRFSCSIDVPPGNVVNANLAAETIIAISKLGECGADNDDDEKDASAAPSHLKGGLGNFRFCAAASCKPFIPFFPAAKSDGIEQEDDVEGGEKIKFAIGLENGPQAREFLKACSSIDRIKTNFKEEMAKILSPIQSICERVANEQQGTFLGIDSSLNPSLADTGSVGSAFEMLKEVKEFGGPGTLGAASEITRALQSLDGVKLTGYCGVMLPVCEDKRLAELQQLRIMDLLSISSVCGVGIDTVPVPGDVSKEDLASLILDVAGIAGRWDKSLSCRVFPVPGSKAGDRTNFDSPYMVNSNIFSIS